MRIASLVCTILLSSVALAGEQSGASTSPADRTGELIKNFKKVKGAEKSPAHDQVVDDLDSSFDFESITTSLMAPRVDKFTKDQQSEFKKKFHQLIRTSAFVDTGDFFNTATLQQKPVLAAGEKTTVPVHVTRESDDTDMEIGLQWMNKGGQLKIVDVLLDGDSLISDYRNRITSIVDKKGVPALFETLDGKIAKVDQHRAK